MIPRTLPPEFETYEFKSRILNELAGECYRIAMEHGFHDDDDYTDKEFGMRIALAHSELSEALDERRKPDGSDEKIAEELADAVIRIFDTAFSEGFRIGDAIIEKMAKNEERPRLHGKKF